MEDGFKRFDLNRKPTRQNFWLKLLIKTVAFFELKMHKTKITKINTENLKGKPYLLLCNHNAFFDFFVAATCVYPSRANYVVAIDGFTTPIGKKGFMSREWLMRPAGCICKRKFTNDMRLIRQLKCIMDKGDVAVVYPEARYSLCGTTAVLPDSLGKMCKILGYPVVTLICHGNHINAPFWNPKDRSFKHNEAIFEQLLSTEDIKNLSAEEINARIRKNFEYDDFAWLRERGLKIDKKNRAEGLHKVLYQCPHCLTEFKMRSKEDTVYCEACNKQWKMDVFGVLRATEGETEFQFVPAWYEWERENVRKEIKEGTYSFSSPVHVMSLPNSKGYKNLGEGTMEHNMNGFRVKVTGPYGTFEMDKPVSSLYSCHIEYDYLGRYGDCVDLNTLEDTWYTFPECEDFSVTKMALATEELYYAN